MKIELQRPGEEVDENKQGVVTKAEAGTSDEVSAHGAELILVVQIVAPH